MDQLWEVAVFAGKAILVVGGLVIVTLVIANISLRLKPPREQLEVENLNERFMAFSDAIEDISVDPKTRKAQLKARRKEEKQKQSQNQAEKPRIFVLDFAGDLRASVGDQFRDEVTAVLAVAKPERDEVVVRLESQGGMVHAYGLAAAQMLRLRDRGIKLTACVDKVAASGGYMMACTASQILAAPFAIVGSIGVIAQVPNVHRLLKHHDIDYEEITAGEFKRTVSVFAEITPKGRAKFVEQIEDTHQLFKEFVHTLRPKLDLTQVATGEYWFGHRALELGLVDKLQSSDDYLFSKRDEAMILNVRIQIRKPLSERLALGVTTVMERAVDKGLTLLRDRQV